tara:strand:- start:23456 stop:24013 length:558 start_codon:yes stop_codon:yes gene_type:complete
MMADKHIVFDRDGTLIKYIPYLFMAEDIQLKKEVRESLKLLKDKGHKMYLHTNQSGVSREYFTLKDVVKCNDKMIELIGLGENLFQRICIATDYPAKKISYRKPSPKFGNEIIKDFNLNKSSLIYIGDSISDLLTAKNIGCRAYGIKSGINQLTNKNLETFNLNFQVFDSIAEIIDKILNEDLRL